MAVHAQCPSCQHKTFDDIFMPGVRNRVQIGILCCQEFSVSTEPAVTLNTFAWNPILYLLHFHIYFKLSGQKRALTSKSNIWTYSFEDYFFQVWVILLDILTNKVQFKRAYEEGDIQNFYCRMACIRGCLSKPKFHYYFLFSFKRFSGAAVFWEFVK